MQINFFIAFLGGVASILSPCILPLIPAYFAYLSGIALNDKTAELTKNDFKNSKKAKTDDDSAKKTSRHKTFQYVKHAILFSIGFSVVFVIFGAAIGSLGKFLILNKRIIEIIGGIIIIIFALQISGFFAKLNLAKLNLSRLNFFNKEKRLTLAPKTIVKLNKFSTLKSLLTGAIFAFGWSPCYGPILGSILTLSIVDSSFCEGLLMFAAYSIGMTISLIVLALLASRLSTISKKARRTGQILKIIMSVILLLLGLSMTFGQTSFLANSIDNLYIKYDLNKF